VNYLPKNEDIIAIVNGVPLTGTDFYISRKIDKLLKKGGTRSDWEYFRLTLSNELLRQEATALGIRISEREVLQTIDTYKKEQGGTRNLYGTDKPTPAMRKEMENTTRVIITSLSVLNKMSLEHYPLLSHEALKKFYEDNIEEFARRTDRYHVVSIEFADQRQQIEPGQLFATALKAIQYVAETSIDAVIKRLESLIDRSLFDWFEDIYDINDPQQDYNPAKYVVGLKPNQMAGPIEIEGGFAVYYLRKHYPPGPQSLEELAPDELDVLIDKQMTMIDDQIISGLLKKASITFPGPWDPEVPPGWMGDITSPIDMNAPQ